MLIINLAGNAGCERPCEKRLAFERQQSHTFGEAMKKLPEEAEQDDEIDLFVTDPCLSCQENPLTTIIAGEINKITRTHD